MKYCIVENGAFVKRVGDEQIDWDATHSCTPSALTPDEKILFGVVEFVESAQPVYDPVTHSVAEIAPSIVAGKWTQQWRASALDAATVAANVANAKISIIRSIDADVDAIYAALLGNREAEYALAEKEATAYRDAGYAGTVPASVQAWATAKTQTATWAADDILAAASGWRAAQAAIRSNRLARKEAARNAADAAALATVQAQWAGFLAVIRAQLGL